MTLEKPLSVLHFSTADLEGGSARSALQVHNGLRERGNQSRMLVRSRHSEDPDIDTIWLRRRHKIADGIADKITSTFGAQYLYLPSSMALPNHPWVQAADVIQLFNTHGGYFSHRILPTLARNSPVIWRLSDMWPMTGHCSYSGDCEQWLNGCGNCPDLDTYPGLKVDTTSRLWKVKQRVCSEANLTVVAPSSWMEEQAKKSPVFEGCPIHRIPNGVDINAFKPLERSSARALLGLPQEVHLILFVAQGLDQDERKGTDALVKALTQLQVNTSVELVLAGLGKADWADETGLKVHRLGYLLDDRLLAAAYSSADIIALPSIVDNLPNVVLESMACGVPSVAFNVGGIRDAVRHMETGYLSRSGNTEDFRHGITMLLDDMDLRLRLGGAGLELIQSNFTKQIQAHRFETLYRQLLNERKLKHPA